MVFLRHLRSIIESVGVVCEFSVSHSFSPSHPIVLLLYYLYVGKFRTIGYMPLAAVGRWIFDCYVYPFVFSLIFVSRYALLIFRVVSSLLILLRFTLVHVCLSVKLPWFCSHCLRSSSQLIFIYINRYTYIFTDVQPPCSDFFFISVVLYVFTCFR